MQVFISHSHKDDVQDQGFLAVRAALQNANVPLWNVAEMKSGESLAKQLRTAIVDCKACVFVATSQSIRSKWCLAEVGAFWGAGKKVVVYLADSTLTESDIPPQFKGNLWTRDPQNVIDSLRDELATDTDIGVEPFTPTQVASVLDVVVADAKVPMFFTSNNLEKILACNQQIADLLRSNRETVKSKSVSWLVIELSQFVSSERREEFIRRQQQMRERFLKNERDYDYEDEILDCRSHPPPNPQHGLWRIRIHAHRVKRSGKPVGFYVYYSMDKFGPES